MPTHMQHSLIQMPEPSSRARTVGILGGMGPAATVDFYDKLIRSTPVTHDQEHLRIVLWADPTTPDRAQAFEGTGPDPTPWLEQGIQHLIECGAEVLVVPCNTVHIYLPAALRNKNIEFISIIDAAVEAALKAQPGTSIGLLATNATLASGLYQRALAAQDMEPILPAAGMQNLLTTTIYRVKAGDTGPQVHQDVKTILEQLSRGTTGTVICACTEISVLLSRLDTDIRIIDTSLALAHKTVDRARRPLTIEV